MNFAKDLIRRKRDIDIFVRTARVEGKEKCHKCFCCFAYDFYMDSLKNLEDANNKLDRLAKQKDVYSWIDET